MGNVHKKYCIFNKKSEIFFLKKASYTANRKNTEENNYHLHINCEV